MGWSNMRAAPTYPEAFGAKIYKIAWDPQGNRLTYLKVTGGSLKVRALLSNRRADLPEEKGLGGEGQPDSHLFGRKISGGG